MEEVSFITWCLDHLNYWIITLLMTIESSFIPFPSEIVVPPAAYRAATSSEMNVFGVVFFATLGADLGALINYFIARTLGRVVVYRFADSRFGHLCLIDRDKVENAEKYFSRHGAISTFIGRLIPAIRQLISIPAGLAKMSVGKFLLFTTIGAALWNIVLASVGYGLASAMPEDEMMAKVTEYNNELKLICGIVIAAFLVWLGLRYWLRKRKKSKQTDK